MNIECLDSRWILAVDIYCRPEAESGEAMEIIVSCCEDKEVLVGCEAWRERFRYQGKPRSFLSSGKGKDTTKSLAERLRLINQT
jgi:hypothetical protein